MKAIESIAKNKEELIIRLIEILQGKEAKAKIKLDGIEFKIADSAVKLDGEMMLTFTAFKSKGK